MNEKQNGKALGRGLTDIMNESAGAVAPILPKHNLPVKKKDIECNPSERVQVAEAIPAIMKILDGINPRYHGVIFESILGIQRVAHGDEITEWNEKSIAARKEIQNNQRPRGWFK